MSNIEISVIVTVYNIEQYIGECLDSILQQKDSNFEIICVDDASTDSSYDILKDYMKIDARIKVIKMETNAGLTSARNAGYRVASGKYVYNIDGDDILAENALKKMCEVMNCYELDMLGFSAIPFFQNKEMHMYCDNLEEYVRKSGCMVVKEGPEMFAFLLENNEPVRSNMCLYCIRKSFIQDNNLYGTEGLRYVDDSMFLLYMYANKVMCIPDVLYKRRYRPGSTVVSPMRPIYLECMIVLFVREYSCWQSLVLKENVNKVIEQYFHLRLQEIDSFTYQFAEKSERMNYLEHHPAAKFFFDYVLNNKPLYENIIKKTDLIKIQVAKKIILYGAGYFSRKIIEVLKYYKGSDYKCDIVVTKKNNDCTIEGFTIFELDNVTADFFNESLVIAAVSKKYRREIEDNLKEYELSDIIWLMD